MPDPKTKEGKAGEKENAGEKTPEGAGGKPAANQEPLVFDTWKGEQSDEVKTMLDANTSGLKSALESERGSRKDLEGDLRDLAKKAEGDQKLALEGLAEGLETADRKTDFYETAHAAGVSNLKLGYQIALSDEMFDRRGNVNFDTMKDQYPELFSGKAKTPKGGAGDGHGNNQDPGAFDMNAQIRKAAGRS